MAKLSDAQLAGLVQKAGFPSTHKNKGYRDDAVAVAVAIGESGGDPNAHNPKPPDDSYGLFQINMYGDLERERLIRYGMLKKEDLFFSGRNADVAYDLYKRAGQGFTDWSVYNNNSFLLHMPRALRAVKAPSTDLPEREDKGFFDDIIPDELQAIGDFFGFISDSKNWLRVAYFVGGGIVLIVGTLVLAKESGAINQVANVIPVGRIAKAAKGASRATKVATKVASKAAE